MKIRKITIRNFGNIQERVIEFGNKTEISGRNMSGKTTVSDAYAWVMTNKLMNGTQANGIRPHDQYGKDVDFIDIHVIVELEVNGKIYEIEKIQSQEWNKKSGDFKGNKNQYIVNGVPKRTEKDFGAFLSEEIVKSEIFQSCTNSSWLLKLDTAKRRAELFKLIPEITNESIIELNSKFEYLRPKLQDGSIEELIARCRYKLNGRANRDKGLKGMLVDIPTRIDEVSRNITDTNQINILIKGLKEKLEILDKQEEDILQKSKKYDDLANGIMELKFKISDYERDANKSNIDKKTRLQRELNALEIEKSELVLKEKMLEKEIQNCDILIRRNKKELQDAREDYPRVKAEMFDETTINHYKEMEFDEKSTFCPACNQILPTERIDEIKKDFENKKQSLIAQEEERRKKFEYDKKMRLEGITRVGNEANVRVKETLELKNEKSATLTYTSSRRLEIEGKMLDLKLEIVSIPDNVDLSNDAEYQKIVSELNEKEEEIKKYSSGSAEKIALNNERFWITEEIAKHKSAIERNELIQKRVDELKEERKLIVQQIADCEKELDLLKEFNRKKCSLMENKLNELFKFVKWKMFRLQTNGDYEEICEPTYLGTGYSKRLNDGARGLIDIDICNTFQKFYGVNLPIFVDNAERMTEDTIKLLGDMECQLVFLRAKENDFTVKEI